MRHSSAIHRPNQAEVAAAAARLCCALGAGTDADLHANRLDWHPLHSSCLIMHPAITHVCSTHRLQEAMAANMQDVAQRMRDIKIKLDQVPLLSHSVLMCLSTMLCYAFLMPATLCGTCSTYTA